MRKSKCVIQFAKWPVIGNVKTRLANHLGDELARRIHIKLAEQVYANVSSAEGVEIEIHVDEVGASEQGWDNGIFDRWERASLLTLQKGPDLGSRMAGAIHEGLKHYDKVIIVGSDCPSVDASYLDHAFAALSSSSMVIGPAEDGGYVLVGASSPIDQVFDGVDWGGTTVFSKTIANAKRLNIEVEILDERWDVDEIADYVRWKNLPSTK